MNNTPYIPFLDLRTVNEPYVTNLEKHFSEVLRDGRFIRGTQVANFEKAFATYCGVNCCVGVGNGLDALTLILKGYIELEKIKPGDEVIVAANTYIATILSIIHAGLVPVFVEPDNETFNLDPKKIASKISSKTKVILPTHLYGQLAEMDAINTIASAHDLLVITDAAQAHGAVDDQNRVAGSMCNAAAFSFYPTKNLGALGDSGAIVTNDEDLASILKSLSNYGTITKYENNHIGYNSRLDEIQAAFLLEKLQYLTQDNIKRRAIAKQYLSQINNGKIKLPYWDGTDNHVFHLFVVRVKDRGGFSKYMEKSGVGCAIHYPIPPHKQKALQQFSYLSLPITEEIHETVISIPLNVGLTEREISYIIKILNNY